MAVVLLGACRVETTVGVSVDDDGSGQIAVDVVLDADAVRRVGDVKEEIRTSDLRAAGWEVEGPQPVDGGGQRLRVSRPFNTPQEAEAIFRSLATPESPFGRVDIDQRRGFWSTKTTFAATVDLSGGLEAFSDPQLSEALGGQPLGVPAEQLEQRLGAALDRVFQLRVAARLPGDIESNAPRQLRGGAMWTPKLGETVTLEASSTAVNRPRIVFAVIALTSAVAAVALAGSRLFTRRRHHLPASLRPAEAGDDPDAESPDAEVVADAEVIESAADDG